MQDLSHLLSLDPNSAEWEAERCRLVKAEIDRAPAEHQKAMRALQYELDLARERMTSEEFMDFIAFKARENNANLEDKIQYVKNITGQSGK